MWEYREIEAEKIIPMGTNENPREMTAEEFDALCGSIREHGFMIPLIVKDLGDGTYKIVDGNHRYVAGVKVFKMTRFPCIVVKSSDDVDFWIKAIGINNIRGEWNAVRLKARIKEIFEKTMAKYGEEKAYELKRKLGFIGERTMFDKAVKELLSKVQDTEKRKLLEEKIKKIESVEELHEVMKEIYRQLGDAITDNLLIFSYGGTDIAIVKVKRKTMELIRRAKQDNVDLEKVVEEALKVYG